MKHLVGHYRARQLMTTLLALLLGSSLSISSPANTGPAQANALADTGVHDWSSVDSHTTMYAPLESATSPQSADAPSVVSITGSNYDYVYTVDGRRQTVRGVGYNAVYRFLKPEARGARYDRDFAIMKKAGINTIIGWEQDKGFDHDSFDELTLARAQANGIGVILPYYLPPDADYSDPLTRVRIKEDAAAYVERFKGYPALRMWGIGNEVMLTMESRSQAKAFGSFYVELADLVHGLDPNHPVLYREAEDTLAYYIGDALANDGVRRPWLAYGMNIYTYRISEALTDWPVNGWDGPVVISEFAPIGVNRGERSEFYVKMWNQIRSRPSMALGGIIYVWTTAGPEPVDREYGLVDENGVPVDDALAKIAEVFTSEAQAEIAKGPLDSQVSRR